MGKINIRRATDVIGAFAGLILLSPMMAAAAVVSHCTTHLPFIFKQTRYGLNGKPFTLYKFRTMTDARDGKDELLPDDLRVTRLGKLMRRFAVDELPQLWNIVKDDMSLVGPRPLPEKIDIPNWNKRYDIKPGMTGLAQIQTRPIALEERLKYDLEYIQNRRLSLDLKIVFRTGAIVLTGRNKYGNLIPAPAQPKSAAARAGLTFK